jgi:hypothetical protein
VVLVWVQAAALSTPAQAAALGWARPAHDVGLDHKVVSTTNHHKMFDIVTADEDDASFPVDRQGFDYCYPRWCVAAAEPVEHVSSGRNDNEKICFHRRDGPELGPAPPSPSLCRTVRDSSPPRADRGPLPIGRA